VFDAANWRRAQAILVTGQPDHVDDGDQPYRIELTVDAPNDVCYRQAEIAPVELVNVEFRNCDGAAFAGTPS